MTSQEPAPNEQAEKNQADGQADAQPGEAGGAAEAAPEAPEVDPMAQLAAERDELKDRMLRMAAETENFKKRLERDKADYLRRANENFAKDLLPVLDNLERALSHASAPGSQGPLAEGVQMTSQELVKVLERHGLEKIEALGQPFNPEFHEAMMQQEDPSKDENTVLMELQKGYMFQGRLLRPAMVIVSKKPAPVDDEGTEVKIKIN